MPSFETERLILRAPQPRDAGAIARGLGDSEVSKTLVSLPFCDAATLIARAAEAQAKGEAYSFTVEHKDTHELVGMASLQLSLGFYELSFWIARPYWDFGYASEAARKIAAFAFGTLKTQTLLASWCEGSPASERVLEKLGFIAESDYRRESFAGGRPVWCHRMVLHRKAFGRKHNGQRRQPLELVGA